MTFKTFISLSFVTALIVCMLGQLLIDSSITNVYSTLIIAFSTLTTLAYLYWGEAYSKSPISGIVILSLLFTGLFGALLFQTLYWNPVTKYLFNPLYTFYKLALYQLVGIVSHYIYITFIQVKSAPKYYTISIKGALAKIGLYNIPSVYTIWIICSVGLVSYILAKIIPGTPGKILLNLRFLMWAPFFILFYIYKFGEEYTSPKRQYILISIFFLLTALVGITFNVRAIIVTGIVNLFLIAIIILLSENTKYSPKTYLKITILALLVIGLLKPLSSFSDAMLAARSEREKISGVEMLSNTLDLYLNYDNEELLENDKFIENKIYTDYDEDYIENGILTRFVLTRFHDNAFYYSSELNSSGKKEIRNFTRDKLIAILPQPVLDIVGIELDKTELEKTTADILVHEATGRRLGGFKVPSTFAEVELLFGPYAPLIFLCLAFVFFSIIDLFSITIKSNGLFVTLPFFSLASVYLLFQLPVYSTIGVITLLVRGFIQNILIYCLLIFILSYLFKPFRKYNTV